jgi:hypothetical protein
MEYLSSMRVAELICPDSSGHYYKILWVLFLIYFVENKIKSVAKILSKE